MARTQPTQEPRQSPNKAEASWTEEKKSLRERASIEAYCRLEPDGCGRAQQFLDPQYDAANDLAPQCVHGSMPHQNGYILYKTNTQTPKPTEPNGDSPHRHRYHQLNTSLPSIDQSKQARHCRRGARMNLNGFELQYFASLKRGTLKLINECEANHHCLR